MEEKKLSKRQEKVNVLQPILCPFCGGLISITELSFGCQNCNSFFDRSKNDVSQVLNRALTEEEISDLFSIRGLKVVVDNSLKYEAYNFKANTRFENPEIETIPLKKQKRRHFRF
ncbi:MAG: hypothetical protein E7242_01140 [Lachnospiraceae bacterium]|nr:hypothetical protein [Lachnospiraceae bacterium]